MSIFVIHSTHELHQLKKVLLLLRGDMTTLVLCQEKVQIKYNQFSLFM